ncbi:glycosyltransferase family 4 protein [Microbacterium sp. JZ31]|uniref:glycosyltransferase family 4 protein n=1 Tax=Microbacterium sp. JZ31 TaxID=1906274 RepID=UPI0019314B03|nr:glycosyltransferase family 4 protein [Microbacterium sp. JZ31]
MTADDPRRSRVLLATRLFVPEVSAGSFRLGALAEGLVARGAEVDVVTTRPPRALRGRTVRLPGVRIRRWPVLRDAGGNVRGYIQYLSFDAPLALRLIGARADVIVAEAPPTTGLVAAVVARLRRRPLAYYAADVWTDGVVSMGAPRVVAGLMRVMERAALRASAVVLSVSPEVTERLVVLGAERDRIATIGNGIDTTVFSPDVEPHSPGRPYFVYTGTMSEWQRPDVFVRAFARIADRHPDVDLRFFGQGALQSDLRALAERAVPGRVHFGGVVPPSDSARWIRGALAAMVSIAPGVGYDFARPTKTYAAAACGTPVLFAGAPTGRDLVTTAGLGEGVGFEEDQVAAAMERLIAQHRSGATEAHRTGRSAWARENVSLAAAGQRAADAVLGAIADRHERNAT